MRFTRPTILVSALLAAAAVGCAPERTPEPDPPVAMEQPMQPLALLPEEVIQQLQAEYPVLRETPAPEPQPNGDADPAQVPERVREALPERVLQTVTGEATFYADRFEGRRTASGIPFRQNQMVAAHRAYPFGTILRVTNTRNNRSVNVRVVDRGPFSTQRTIIDLSRRAAQQLGYIDAGRTPVRVEVLEWGEGVRGTGAG